MNWPPSGRDLEYRPFVLGVRAGDPMVDYLPSTVESLAGTIVGRGLLSEQDLAAALADCARRGRRAVVCVGAIITALVLRSAVRTGGPDLL